ncbi:hypothetical protein vseg_006406 [Gypsophila vaccaria]
MTIYYKFKSAKDYYSITLTGHFISVIDLKERIFESKRFGRGNDFDLIVYNSQTNEEYVDEATLIPKNTSVVIRRVPGLPRKPIVIQSDKSEVEINVADEQPAKGNTTTAASSLGASEFDDDFGDDIYVTIPEVTTKLSNILVHDSTTQSSSNEDSKIKAIVESSNFTSGRGCGSRQKTPPHGYICHRCNIPGHYIQHCPTNGDPSHDVRRVKPSTGIPKSMLAPAPDGSYVLPSGASAVLKSNESAFDKEVEGISSSRSSVNLPPELHCPLCNQVMKDAVFASKCCFKSFCDKCIRDFIISKSMCFCEAKNVLADDLLPNKTVRDTINRILESGHSSADNVSSSVHIQDLESAHRLPSKSSSPTQSAVSNVEQKFPPTVENAQNIKESVDKNEATSGKETINEICGVSKATPESTKVKEHVSQNVAVLAEAQQKLAPSDTGKMKKRKMSGADIQGMAMQPGMNGYAGPSNVYPYSQGMQPQMDGYMVPFAGNMPYNMGYHLDPIALPWANVMPPEMVEPRYFTYPPTIPPQSKELPRYDNVRKHSNNADVSSKHKSPQVRRSPGLDRERESRRSNEGSSLERKRKRDHYHGHDRESHRHHPSINDERHFKRKASRDTRLGVDEEAWRRGHSHSIRC